MSAGTACGAGGMLAVQSVEETAFEDFWFPRPLIKTYRLD